jgi:photosystem II stability/assembly factor-like uncharacterized protein
MKIIIILFFDLLLSTILLFSQGYDWNLINDGVTSRRIRSIYTNSSGIILFGASGEGLYKSSNDGNSWAKANNGLTNITSILAFEENSANYLLIATDWDGVCISTNNGDKWDKKTPEFTFVSCIDRAKDGTIYAGTKSCVIKSTDGGNSWEKCSTGLDAVTISAIATDNGIIFISQGTGGCFKSIDGGNSWNKIEGVLSGIVISSIVKGNDGYVFASNGNNAIFRTTDGGSSWQNLNLNTTDNIYISSPLNASNDGYIAFGTLENGIFVSTDNGDNWTQQKGTILEEKNINSILMSQDGYIYVGRSDGKLYHRKLLPLTVNEFGNNIDIDFYPNPVTSSANVRFYLNKPEFLKIEIAGIDGRKESVIDHEFFSKGENYLSVNIDNLPAGLYQLIISNGKILANHKFLVIK